jgi:hypothetical protein
MRLLMLAGGILAEPSATGLVALGGGGLADPPATRCASSRSSDASWRRLLRRLVGGGTTEQHAMRLLPSLSCIAYKLEREDEIKRLG